MNTDQGRPFNASTSKLAYAQAFTGTSRRAERAGLFSRLSARRARSRG